MSNYTIRQLEIVQYNINHIHKITYETQDELEARKNTLLQQLNTILVTKGTSDELSEENKMKVTELKSFIEDINRNIDTVQYEHDQIMSELERRKQNLKKTISTLGKLEILIDVLTHKIFDKQQEFQENIEMMLLEKDNTLQRVDMPSFKLAIKAAEIDKQMNNLTNTHEESILHLEGQREELRKETAMKTLSFESTLESVELQYRTILNELEQSKFDANECEIDELNRRIAELNRLYQNDIDLLNRLNIWKNLEPEESLQAIIENKESFIKQMDLSTASKEIMKGQLTYKEELSRSVIVEGGSISSWSSYLKLLGAQQKSESVQLKVEKDSRDVSYLKSLFRKPLRLALAEIAMKKPRDPIAYLGHWLFNYRYNQEISLAKKREIRELIAERQKLEKEKLHIMFEREAHDVVLNMIIRAEEESIRNKLERIARETMEYAVEEAEYDSEARDVFGELSKTSSKKKVQIALD